LESIAFVDVKCIFVEKSVIKPRNPIKYELKKIQLELATKEFAIV